MQIRSTAYGMTKTENGVKWAIWINGEIVAYANDKNHARNKLRILENQIIDEEETNRVNTLSSCPASRPN